jgi:sulfite reductase (ferredoxin)
MTNTMRRSKLEAIKEKSNFLRGPIDEELNNGDPFFSKDGIQILKFHGSYQQKDRDLQKAKAKGEAPAYSMMLRTRSPGGIIPWQLYLTLDKLCDRYGNHTLRATTRQGFQIHGILKQDLKTVIADIVKNMGSTVGACGDINRNVMAPPAPFKNKPAYVYAREYADKIADLLAPQGGAYYDVWLDGEKAVSAEAPEVTAARNEPGRGKKDTNIANSDEPIYGTHYMPRKFKVAIAVPGDNSVDLFTNDLGLVVITDKKQNLLGFNAYVGGGLGRSHNNEATIVRIADPIAFVPVANIYEFTKAVVAVQRDNGDRFNRKHARLKYLLNDWGVDKFKQVLSEYYPEPLEPLKPTPEWQYLDYLGWHEQGDGQYFVGISIENGRIIDHEGFKLKAALQEIIHKYHLPIHLTPNHNALLCDIAPHDRDDIQEILDRHGILSPEQVDPLVRYSMACPALPTCGLAITESERILPDVMARLRNLLERLGLGEEKLITRMTGCPNGCARPYMAELGFVGTGVDAYQLWLGGNFNSTRLAAPFIQSMPLAELETTLEPLFVYFKQDRNPQEGFGNFCDRVGFEQLRNFSASYVASKTSKSGKSKDQRHRVTLSTDAYDRLKQAASDRGQSMKEIVEMAIAKYLE